MHKASTRYATGRSCERDIGRRRHLLLFDSWSAKSAREGTTAVILGFRANPRATLGRGVDGMRCGVVDRSARTLARCVGRVLAPRLTTFSGDLGPQLRVARNCEPEMRAVRCEII